MHFILYIMHSNPTVYFICATALYKWLLELLHIVTFSVVFFMYFVFLSLLVFLWSFMVYVTCQETTDVN